MLKTAGERYKQTRQYGTTGLKKQERAALSGSSRANGDDGARFGALPP